MKTTGKAVLGAVGLTGDPVGQTAQEGLEGAAGIAAEEVDDRLAENPNPSTSAREALGIANPADNDRRTVESRHRDQIQPRLQAGERLLAVCECETAPGVPERPVRLRQPPQESELERRLKSRLPGAMQRLLRPSERKSVTRLEEVMEGAEQATENAFTRAAHSKGMHGGWESQAGRFLVTHYTAARLPATLAVAFTNRRVLAFADRAKLWQTSRAYELQWEAPRSTVLGVRANPKGVLQRGRFELMFADGSWIALVASVPTHAELFAAQAGSSG
ncbi:hypothetical protein [Streptomyces sp. SD31]|uniref:hypothetical protein n=1 Tax=Streptomyces sp. SD31 TaxID=3452208 RepID=UPI003F89B306